MFCDLISLIYLTDCSPPRQRLTTLRGASNVDRWHRSPSLPGSIPWDPFGTLNFYLNQKLLFYMNSMNFTPTQTIRPGNYFTLLNFTLEHKSDVTTRSLAVLPNSLPWLGELTGTSLEKTQWVSENREKLRESDALSDYHCIPCRVKPGGSILSLCSVWMAWILLFDIFI